MCLYTIVRLGTIDETVILEQANLHGRGVRTTLSSISLSTERAPRYRILALESLLFYIFFFLLAPFFVPGIRLLLFCKA